MASPEIVGDTETAFDCRDIVDLPDSNIVAPGCPRVLDPLAATAAAGSTVDHELEAWSHGGGRRIGEASYQAHAAGQERASQDYLV